MHRLRIPFITAAILAVITAPLAAAVTKADRLTRDLPLSFDGTLRLENPYGNVTIIGTEKAGLSVVAERIVTAVDENSANEARRVSGLHIGSDGRNVLLQSLIPFPNPNPRWNITVNYTLRVPRTAHLQTVTGVADRIQITNISGNVLVKNTTAAIDINAVSGSMQVDTANGDVTINLPKKPTTNIRASSINGKVEIVMPADSSFNWTAEALRGKIASNFDARGDFDSSKPGKYYKGVVKSSAGPQIQTFTVMGSIVVRARNTTQLVELRPKAGAQTPMPSQGIAVEVRNKLLQPPSARSFVFQQDMIPGDFTFDTSLGNIFVNEVRGSADVFTRAGEIILATVIGAADAESLGGPINLGQIGGTVNARTEAGDVSVTSAQRGGFAGTGGGNITVGYSGGTMTAVSGGGDVTIRRALGAVNAETRSGDITINLDPTVKSQRVEAKVAGGNIIFNVGAQFGAEIDATVITSDPQADTIVSDLAGLTITTEQVGGRSRIHAVGKVNGGGQRVELRAEDGGIQIKHALRR